MVKFVALPRAVPAVTLVPTMIFCTRQTNIEGKASLKRPHTDYALPLVLSLFNTIGSELRHYDRCCILSICKPDQHELVVAFLILGFKELVPELPERSEKCMQRLDLDVTQSMFPGIA